MLQSHVGDVIDIDLRFEDNSKDFSIEFDSEDRRREKQFAYHGFPLRRDDQVRHQSFPKKVVVDHEGKKR